MIDVVVEGTTGSVEALHHRPLPEPLVPTIWVHHFETPALVLGSSQADAVVDRDACRRAGVDVVRRRSGGGAVLLVPGQVVWIDVVLPRGTRAALDDVRAGMVWIGSLVRDALVAAAPALADRMTVHDGPLVATPWSATVCFDGIGPGEVLLDGSKLVGLSQRLTREAARFQASWHTAYDPAALVALLAPEFRAPVGELRPVATVDPVIGSVVCELLAGGLRG